MTYHEALTAAEKRARQHHKEASAVKLLLLHFSFLSPSELYLKFDEEMTESAINAFNEAMDKYIVNNIPVQYIIGSVSFYGYEMFVDSNVLIPRFETEELVANTLMFYDEVFGDKDVKLVDVGTGSGCLALALAKEEPHFEVFASDISEGALSVAKKNANHLDAKITFFQGNMLEPLKGMKFDILVSNPPYIPNDELVDSIITENEPHVALFGGSDGMYFYDLILKNAAEILNPKFIIAFEHAYDKKDEMRALANQYFPSAEVIQYQDMQGKDRMTFVIQKNE